MTKYGVWATGATQSSVFYLIRQRSPQHRYLPLDHLATRPSNRFSPLDTGLEVEHFMDICRELAMQALEVIQRQFVQCTIS